MKKEAVSVLSACNVLSTCMKTQQPIKSEVCAETEEWDIKPDSRSMPSLWNMSGMQTSVDVVFSQSSRGCYSGCP